MGSRLRVDILNIYFPHWCSGSQSHVPWVQGYEKIIISVLIIVAMCARELLRIAQNWCGNINLEILIRKYKSLNSEKYQGI